MFREKWLKKKRRWAALLSNWRWLLTFLFTGLPILGSSCFGSTSNLMHKTILRTILDPSASPGKTSSINRAGISKANSNLARKLVH
jgi:hypothetical protein